MPARLTIDEVTARLGVKRATVYAYVSRGYLSSEPSQDGRTSTFDPAEVAGLVARSRPRRRPRLGEGIDASLVSDVTELRDGAVAYRGHPLAELVAPVGGGPPPAFEAVAELLWTGRLAPADPWPAPPAAVRAARAVLSAAGGAELGDRLRLAVVAASATDPLRHDLRPEAVLDTGRDLIAAVAAALGSTSGRPEAAARPIAARLADAIDPRLASRWIRPLEVALVCLADHELATSTLAARVAASTRADPTQVVLAGLATVSGPLHGTASVAVHRFLTAAADDPRTAIAEQLRANGRLPGFGHPVHRHGDPRAAPLEAAVRAAATSRHQARLALVERVVDLAAERAPVARNIDFSLGMFSFVAGLPPAATELIFSVARMAGWIAHGLEEYAEAPLRFRARATTSRAS
jgi:citrate synthase